MKHQCCKLFLLILTSLSVVVDAEVITIPIGQQGDELQTLDRPQRGTTGETVLERFGEPMSMSPARGEPPISHWRYENFTVYFEHDTVIHSVLRHTPKHPVK